MTDALYVPEGDTLVPSELVTSPWSPDTSHGGPPSGLLVRAIERLVPHGIDLISIGVEILRPIPIVPLRAEARIRRSGRRIQLAEAVLMDADGAELALARAWRIRRRPRELALPVRDAPPIPMPPPEILPEASYRFAPWRHFPVDAEEIRLAGGDLGAPGRTALWFRLAVPLVAGEEPSPEQRFVISSDSANGASRHAETTEMLFVNMDLRVTLGRRPVGVWVGLDASSHWFGSGRGLSDSALYDIEGYVGRTTQALFVDELSAEAPVPPPEGPQPRM